jgi:L-fucose isomerase-like protein
MHPIYEYYDGYEDTWEDEPEDQRAKVRYVVLGSMIGSKSIVICYVPSGFIATINENIHKKAWLVDDCVSIDQLREYTKHERQRYVVSDYEKHIEWLNENKDSINKKHIFPPGNTVSGYNGIYDINYTYSSEVSYTDAVIAALKNKVEVLKIRDAFVRETL